MKTFLLAVLVYSPVALSYPVFFKCDEDGRLSDHLTPSEFNQKLKEMAGALKGLSAVEQKSRAEEYCMGSQLCLQEFKQLMQIADESKLISDSVMSDMIAKMRLSAEAKASEIKSYKNDIFKNLTDYEKMIENIALTRECRIETSKLDKQMMKKGEFCILANFNHSPYMYPSGVRYAEENAPGNSSTKPVKCSAISELILGALAMDQDPYATLAISLMENGTAVEELYLDPIGAVQAVGCPTTRGTETKHNLNSFFTYFNVDYKTLQNPKLVSKFRDFLKLHEEKELPGQSYYCVGSFDNEFEIEELLSSKECEENDNGMICDKPQPNFCCLQMPFKTKPNSKLNKALTFSSLEKYIKAPLSKDIMGTDPSEYPARRLQRFNGYTDSMGGAEGVSAWRSGVNYYKTPAYGYQAMDYILNTLMNNPYVHESIKEAEAKLNRSSVSILCQDRKPGVYSIEHDHYFKKHAEAPRMEALISRFKNNPSWTSMSKRDKRVLIGEMMSICHTGQYESLCKRHKVDQIFEKITAIKSLKPEVIKEVEKEVYALGSNQLVDDYIKTLHPLRKTVSMANEMDQKFKWKPLNDSQYQGFLKAYSSNIDKFQNQNFIDPDSLKEGNKSED